METTTKDVVLNDKTNAIDPAKQVVQVLDRLITDRQGWEVGGADLSLADDSKRGGGVACEQQHDTKLKCQSDNHA